MPTLFETAVRGYEAADQLIRESRAHKAAREQYGARADNPGLFSALENMDLASNRDRRADEQLELQRRGVDRADRQDARQAEVHQTNMGATKDARQKDAVLNLVNGLREARDKGQDVGEAFDALADTLPGLGVSEEDLPAMREELINNPAILDQYYEALTGGKSGSSSKSSTGAAKEAEAREGSETAMRKIDDIINRIDLLESDEFNEVGPSVFGLPGVGVFKGGFGALGAIPGSSAADYVSNLEALKSDIRSQAFETLKGGGQITEKESEFAANAISRMERTTSYAEFQRELRRVRAYMEALNNAAERRLAGEDVPELVWDQTDQKGYARQNGTDTGKIWPGFRAADGSVFRGGDPSNPENWDTGEPKPEDKPK